jgi:argininosuccinate lyase
VALLGLPDGVAHDVIGGLVRLAEERGVALRDLDDAAIRGALAESDDDGARTLAARPDLPALLRDALSIDAALARPDVIGGTAPGRVASELARAEARLGVGRPV